MRLPRALKILSFIPGLCHFWLYLTNLSHSRYPRKIFNHFHFTDFQSLGAPHIPEHKPPSLPELALLHKNLIKPSTWERGGQINWAWLALRDRGQTWPAGSLTPAMQSVCPPHFPSPPWSQQSHATCCLQEKLEYKDKSRFSLLRVR